MAVSSLPTIGAADFEPVHVDRRVQQITRPSLSYWQDAWRRLRRNPRAIISLWTVLGMLAFAIVGPWIWWVDPAMQDLGQVSKPPTLGTEAVVVRSGNFWAGEIAPGHPVAPPDDWFNRERDFLPATEEIAIVGTPTTQGVRLRWRPVDNAAGYFVYRNTYRPTRINELGLPIGETLGGNLVGYEDRLKLDARTHYYSVAATDGVQESENFTVIAVPVRQGIQQEAAREAGYLDAEEEWRPDMVVRLRAHPLGTDYLGRDMLSRLMYGARTSLFIGIVAPAAFILLGILFGAFAGYLGGRWDAVLMRFADFVVALPFLLFMILFRIASGVRPGESGVTPMLLALILLLWPATARLVRGQILQIREEGYVQAARLLGARDGYLIMRHMIPNTMGVILVTLTFAIPTAIFIEAFLSFIGMGVAPPTPSWGSMSFEGLKTMLSYPHELIFPSLFISVTVLAFNLLGDGLRDALDARMRSKE